MINNLLKDTMHKVLKINIIISFAFLILGSHYSLSQEKKWPTLLWEISGNGLSAPSYLYGTMHVSSKLAFHLGDPFFDALESVDVVALELHHENWLDAELSPENIIEMGGSMRDYEFETYTYERGEPYEDYFNYGKDRKELLLKAFRFYPRFASQIVSRNGRESVEYEEDSWLDYFIYKCGRKLKKEIYGLETFTESMHAFELAMKYDNEHHDQTEQDPSDWSDRTNAYEELEKAYRNGDLDKLDSLNKKTSRVGWRKYILDYRNEIFVARIDSILKKKTMFIGMGAAHLPGDAGVIEMLRNLGYTLQPVRPGRRNAKKVEELEKKEFPSTFTRYKSKSGLFELDVPSKVYSVPVNHGISVETCPDLPNASTLYMIRAKNYSGLRLDKPQDIINSIDSLLYENIAGSIESQKTIVLNGFPGIDILNKNRLGHFQRFRIIALEEELLVLRLDGHQEMAKGRYGDKIFSSFKLYSTPSKDLKEFKLPDGSLTVNLPGTPVYYPMDFLQHRDSRLDISIFDNQTGTYYQIMKVDLSNPLTQESDIYELSEIEFSLRSARNLKVNRKDTLFYQGFLTIDGHYEDKQGAQIAARFVLVGRSCYTFICHNPNPKGTELFFSSVRFSTPTYDTFRLQTDTMIHASFEVPYNLPKYSEQPFLLDYGMQENNNSFGHQNEVRYYYPLQGGEMIEVEYSRMGRYGWWFEKMDTLEYWKESITNGGDLIVYDITESNPDNSRVFEAILGDTAISQRQWIRRIILPHASYTLTTSYDSLLGPTAFMTNFFQSFKPHDNLDTTQYSDDRTQLFLSDISSEDSLTFFQAYDLLYSAFLKFDTSTAVIEVMDKYSKWADSDARHAIRNKFLGTLTKFDDKATVDFLVSRYQFWADSTENQAYILELLSSIEDKYAFEQVKKLLVESAPLEISHYDVNSIFRNFCDTVELAAEMYPELFVLLDIDEYELAVYNNLSELLDSGVVTGKDYEIILPTLLNKAKIEFRRETVSRNKVKSAYDQYEGYNYYYTSGSEGFSGELFDYWNLLLPFRKQESVKQYFALVEKTKHKDLLRTLATVYMKKDVPLPDGMIDTICLDMEQRLAFYRSLLFDKKDSLLPDPYRNQEEILDYVVRENLREYNSTDRDSLVYLKCEKLTLRNDTGLVYFYKVQKANEKNWKLCTVGIVWEEEGDLVLDPLFIDTSREKFDEENLSADDLSLFYERQLRRSIRGVVKGRNDGYDDWTMDF